MRPAGSAAARGTETDRAGGGGQGGGLDVARRRGPLPPALRPAPRRPRRDARSRRHRRAARRARPRHAACCASSPAGQVLRGEVVLGRGHETLDASGEVTGTWDMAASPWPTCARRRASLTGVIDQVPPMVSAVQGRAVAASTSWPAPASRSSVPPAPVTVDRFDVHRRRARAGRATASRWTARRAPTSACSPPTSGRPRRRRAPAQPPSHPQSAPFGVEEATTLEGAHRRATCSRPPRRCATCRRSSSTPRWHGPSRTGLALDRVSVGATRRRAVGPVGPGADGLLAVYESTGTDRLVAVRAGPASG